MLKKELRLVKEYAISQVLRRGAKFESPFFSLRTLKAAGSASRFAFVASKRVGKAVVRHRALRLLREALRLKIARVPEGYWLVFIAKPFLGQAGIKLEKINTEMEKTLSVFKDV